MRRKQDDLFSLRQIGSYVKPKTLNQQHRINIAAVALAQARGHLPQGRRRWPRGQGRHRLLDYFLQSRITTPICRCD